MAARHILYFTAETRRLYRSVRGGLEAVGTFGADDAGVAAFAEIAAGLRGTHMHVVADLSGEDFHEDQVPALRGSDREAILQRRLAARYRDARLAAAFTLGFTEGERRNERLLLASFANVDQFTPWLEAISRAGITLAGVYSVPLLAPALAAKLGARSGHALVVTVDAAGLRQSFVEEGRLRFARLERLPEVPGSELASFVRSETSRLLQYLATLRVVPRDGAPIQVFAVAPPGQRAAFEDVLVSDARLAIHTIGIEEAARSIGLKRLAPEAGGEQLYLHLAATRAPREQFARSEDRHAYFLWRLQRGIAAAGVLTFVACSAVAGARWLDVMNVRDQAETQTREARAALAEYERITSGFPVTQTTTENLRITVNEFRAIVAQSSWPSADVAHVSRVLDRFEQLELDRLEWRIDQAGARTGAKPAAGGTFAKPQAKGESTEEYMAVVEVAGRVNATRRSDYRAITGVVQEFADALRGGGAYRIVRTQLPFDVTSDSTLSGDIGEGESAEAPRFMVQIARSLK